MALNYGVIMGPSYAQGRSIAQGGADRMSNAFAQIGGTLRDMEAMDSEALKAQQEEERRQKIQEIYQQGLDEWDSEDSSLYQDLDDSGKFRKFASLMAPYDMTLSQDLLGKAEELDRSNLKQVQDPAKELRNKLENDRVFLGTLQKATSQAYDRFKTTGTAEDKQAWEQSKEAEDMARSQYISTYKTAFPDSDFSVSQAIEEPEEELISWEDEVEFGGSEDEPLTRPEQRTALNNLLNSGIEAQSTQEIEDTLTNAGIMNEQLREEYRQSFKKSALGKKEQAQRGAAAKKSKSWSSLIAPSGQLTKLKLASKDLSGLVGKLEDSKSRLESAKSESDKKAIANAIAQDIARAYQPTGILTDSDLENATSTGNFTSLVKSKLGLSLVDEQGLRSSINLMKGRLSDDINLLQQKANVIVDAHNSQVGDNKEYKIQNTAKPKSKGEMEFVRDEKGVLHQRRIGTFAWEVVK